MIADSQQTLAADVLILDALQTTGADDEPQTTSGNNYSSIPSNTSTSATLKVGQSVYGNLSLDDSDWYKVELKAGETYEFRMHGVGTNETIDPFMRLLDGNGNLLVENDEVSDSFRGSFGGANLHDSLLWFTASTTGTYYISAGSFGLDYPGDYLLTGVVYNPDGMVFTVDEIAWQLSNNYAERDPAGAGAGAFNVGSDGAITVNITALDAAGQKLARQALESWGDVTGIDFVETNGAAEISFDDTDPNGSAVTAYANTNIVNHVITSANVILTTGWLDQFGTTFGSYSYETYIHEIGHALGLGHGGNYNGAATYGVDNYYLNDSVAYAIMSYMNAANDEFTGPNTFIDASFRYMQTTAIADIIAIQNLYGDHSSTRTGNTTYGFNANTGNAALNAAVKLGASMSFTVYDDGGIDTLNFSGAKVAQRIDLRQESFSNVLGGKMNVSIARGVVIEKAIGGSGKDTLIGNSAANALSGGDGQDSLIGGAGNDTLNGGAGTDSLNGGSGNDTYVLSSGSDKVSDSSGTDTITSTVSRSLESFAKIENLTLLGTGNINGTGNSIANRIAGNSGNNVLNGGGGTDTLIGGRGNDTYLLGSSSDKVSDSSGTDTIASTISRSLSSFTTIENLTLRGTGNINGTGNALANRITGNSGNNVLDGRAGSDTLTGGLGNDTYVLSSGSDKVSDSGGRDTITSTISRSLTSFTTIENLTLLGSANINGKGNDLANKITGNSGRNELSGGAKDDVLSGGLGKDTLIGGSGKDTFFFNTTLNATTNVDTITDFKVADDTIRLENSIFTKLTTLGTLAGSAFITNTTGHAADSNDRIIYESDTGRIFYDSNGSASGGSKLFAIVDDGLALRANDFLIS